MRKQVLDVLLVAAVAGAGLSANRDTAFERIVRGIEAHYGTKQTHIPFMGLASFIVKVAHPQGATGLKLAVFEDLKSRPNEEEWRERDAFMTTVAGPHL